MPSIFLVGHQLGDLLEERGLVHLVRKLGDDDGHAVLPVSRLLEGALRRTTTRPRPWAYRSRIASMRISFWPVSALRRSSRSGRWFPASREVRA
jgi:hypothetical protein